MLVFEKVDHIGIAVRNLDLAMNLYKLMGCKIGKSEEVPEMGVRVAFVPIGETRLELLEPISQESVIARFIEKRGEGVHHLCFLVKDIHAMIKQFKKNNFQLIYEEPKIGSENSLVTFVHPKSTCGVLIELRQAC